MSAFIRMWRHFQQIFLPLTFKFVGFCLNHSVWSYHNFTVFCSLSKGNIWRFFVNIGVGKDSSVILFVDE